MSACSNNLQDKKVTVIGGGFAGMTAALQLTGLGARVTLVEKAAAIGGFFPLLDNTFPTHSCGVCFLAPRQPAYCPFIECQLQDNLKIMTSSRPLELSGGPGEFRLSVETSYLGVDPQKCIDCGLCSAACPVSVPDEFSDGLESRAAIYKLYPKMVKGGYLIDTGHCTRCGECVKACPTGAVDLDETGSRTVEIESDAVLLTPGFDLEEGSLKGEYGFGRYANVVTSRQLERMISFSGPTSGLPIRPSDSGTPRKVAFIQCVGSRDLSCGRGYCSSVCCMYATKQAMFIRQRSPETEVVVYYMDLRGMGKDYERYFNRAQNEFGIEYRRSMVSTVHEDPRDRKLNLVYEGEQGFIEEAYDLVVLSLGFDAPKLDFAGAAGIELDRYGFCRTPEFNPTVTSRAGIFAAGAFCGPKDIPETVLEAAAAAETLALSLLRESGDDVVDEKGEAALPAGPDEGAVWKQEPKIGIFLCACSGSLAAEIDFSALQDEFRDNPFVGCVETVDHLCSPEGLRGLRRFIGEYELNRLVLAACSVRELGRLVDAFADEIGFNRNAFAVANLREQVIFPHAGAAEVIAEKVKAQIRSALTAVFRTRPAVGETRQIEPRALVVGGGAAGMTAALALAGHGIAVTLVEKSPALGGRLKEASFTLEEGSPAELLRELSAGIEAQSEIEVLLEAEICEHQGRPGDFTTRVKCGETDHLVRHGALVIATGALEAATDEYLYGQSDRVLTQVEFEHQLAHNPESLKDHKEIVMIQCVGSREPGGREYCSRVCCTHALKNAIALKKISPAARVTVLYRDLRAYGLFEDYYRQARESGVLFTPYELERKPLAEMAGEGLVLRYYDSILKRDITLQPDILVLSTGIAAGDQAGLAGMFDLPLDDYGFFAEANAKAALVDFVGEGRYHCGLASAPVHIREALTRARAAAGRAAAFLLRRELRADKHTVEVNTRLCSGCGLCVEACPYGARELNPATMIADVHYDLCHGCGSCAAVCPNGATQQIGFDKGQVMAMSQAVLKRG